MQIVIAMHARDARKLIQSYDRLGFILPGADLRRMEEAATALGMGRGAILFREVLPNVLPVILVLLSLEMGIAVIVEAILSYVGLSVSTDTPTWGGMIAEGRQIIYQAWWVLVFPLATLFLTVLAFNQLGDGLRQWLDPMLKR